MGMKYFIYQIAGWGLLLVLLWMIGPGGIERPLISVATGLAASHILRGLIIGYGWMGLAVKKVLPRLLVSVLVVCTIMGVIKRMYGYFTGEMYGDISPKVLLASVFDLLLVVIPWTILYYFCYYVRKVQQESVRKRELEMRVKEMEEQSRRSGTDMEAMMDSLRHMQDAIGEDPVRCRKEITEFSKLLREGYLR